MLMIRQQYSEDGIPANEDINTLLGKVERKLTSAAIKYLKIRIRKKKKTKNKIKPLSNTTTTKLYACFVDFKKAFDAAWHAWRTLFKLLQINVKKGANHLLVAFDMRLWIERKIRHPTEGFEPASPCNRALVGCDIHYIRSCTTLDTWQLYWCVCRKQLATSKCLRIHLSFFPCFTLSLTNWGTLNLLSEGREFQVALFPGRSLFE